MDKCFKSPFYRRLHQTECIHALLDAPQENAWRCSKESLTARSVALGPTFAESELKLDLRAWFPVQLSGSGRPKGSSPWPEVFPVESASFLSSPPAVH